MTSKTVRRRIFRADVDRDRYERNLDASRSDSLSEPLCGFRGGMLLKCLSKPLLHLNMNHYCHLLLQRHGQINDSHDWDEKKKARLHWTFLSSNLIAEWAHWLANIVLGSSISVGRLWPFPNLTGNGHGGNSQDALKQLWRLAYPGRELPSLKSELWKEMGWQGSDPSIDFRIWSSATGAGSGVGRCIECERYTGI